MLILQYALSPEDHYAFNFFRLWSDPALKKQRMAYYLRVVIYSAVGLALFHTATGNPAQLSTILVYVAFVVIAILMVPSLIKTNIRKQVNRQLKSPANSNLLAPSEVIISDAGIVLKDKVSESKYEWQAIVKKQETVAYYYLYISTILVITIPKRVFASDLEKKEFDLYLSRNISLEAEFENHILPTASKK
ncbi:MAG: YcxB family protein [Flavisolibacter sp.]